MRLNLVTPLRTRPGDFEKDARMVNCYPEVKNKEAMARKRPGTVPSNLDYNGFQGFSPLSFTPLPYGQWLFEIHSDSWSFGNISGAWSSPSGSYFPFNGTPAAPPDTNAVYWTLAKMGSVLYAVEEAFTNKLRSTANGITWSDINSDTPGYEGTCPLAGAAGVFSDGAYLYGLDGAGEVWRSPNGVSWTNLGPMSGIPFALSSSDVFIFWDGSQFVCIKDYTSIHTSSDFLSWTNIGATGVPRGGCIKKGTRYFAVGGYSDNLVSWTTSASLGNADWPVITEDADYVYSVMFNSAAPQLATRFVDPDTLAILGTDVSESFSFVDGNMFGESYKYAQRIGAKSYILLGGNAFYQQSQMLVMG